MLNKIIQNITKVVLFFAMLNVLQLTAQTNFLSGKIQGEQFIDGGKVTLLVFDEILAKLGWLSLREPDSIIYAPINKDGTFDIAFTPNSSLFYFKLSIFEADREIKELRRDLSLTPYLGESGDSVRIEINKNQDRVQFSGLGSDKLNCQYLLNRFNESLESSGPYYFMGPFNKLQPFTSFEKIYLSNLAYRLSIVDQYDDIIDQSVLNLIRKNVVTSAKYNFASFMAISASSLSNNVSENLRQFFERNDKKNALLDEDMTLSDSPIYCDFILARSELKYKVENKISALDINEHDKKEHYFNWMYNFLKNSYSGYLRDRLITSWFINRSKRYNELQVKVMDEAISLVKEKKYVEALSQYSQTSMGNRVFNFEFIDENDQIHAAKDYMDKILIIDFWFTGCRGCAEIPPVLRLIKEEFKNHVDVVFLSVNVESSKKGWKSGLRSGLYTIPGQIHLKTQGSGRTDQFILNYHIRDYPHLMVIGKNNTVLSVGPRDPRTDNGQDIINIVRQSIQ